MKDGDDSNPAPQAPPSAAPAAPDTAQSLYMVRGFARVFWGLFMSLVLFCGNTTVEILRHWHIPAYVAGVALTGWGLFALLDARDMSRRWRQLVRIALILAGLELYFAPFVVWWKNMPYDPLFLINNILMLFAGMLSLFCINLIVAGAHVRIAEEEGRTEALIFAGGVLLLMIVPMLAAIGFALYQAFHCRTSFVYELLYLSRRTPLWVFILFTVPCSLTLIAVWKARSCWNNLFWLGRAGKGAP